MSERIDHVAEAQGCLVAFDQIGYSNDDGYMKQELMAQAQVHATLALVEQQRIANLLTIQANPGMAVTPEIAVTLGTKEEEK